jgi:hypothetical protein
MTQSNMKAYMSQTIPADMRGTGFAVIAVASGVALAGNGALLLITTYWLTSLCLPGMTQLVKRAPPLIPQQVRGIINAERSQDSL